MNGEETKLNDRDIYVLGVLAERLDGILIRTGKLPRGCDHAQMQALLQAGYVVETPHRFADGSQEMRYEITRKGIEAWHAHRFISETSEVEP
jgi:hypothetical protein